MSIAIVNVEAAQACNVHCILTGLVSTPTHRDKHFTIQIG